MVKHPRAPLPTDKQERWQMSWLVTQRYIRTYFFFVFKHLKRTKKKKCFFEKEFLKLQNSGSFEILFIFCFVQTTCT